MATYISGSQTVIGPTATYADANFRTWVAQIRDALTGVGLVQTSDTGQLNPSTITCPTTNTYPGYEIWRFSDAAQATWPLFIKLEYGKGGSPSSWGLRYQVGTGSNGAGTLTGQLSSLTGTVSGGSLNSASGNGQTYAFFNDGVFWLADAVASTQGTYSSAPRNFVFIPRTRDTSGAIDGRGFLILNASYGGSYGGNSLQFTRTASGALYTGSASAFYCALMGTPASDVVSGSRVSWPIFYYDPGVGVRTMWSAFTIYRGYSPTTPTAFNANPHGTGSRRWITWYWAPWTTWRAAEGDTDNSLGQLVLPWDA